MNSVINWPAIRDAWCAGQSAHSLAKQHNVSHTAINKHHKREGWTRAVVEHQQEVSEVALSQRTLANAQSILDDLSCGVPVHLAAQAVGMSGDDLTTWGEDDTQFAQALSAARARGHVKRIKLIDAAGERGDWKAASWLIERHQETRDDFGQRGSSGGGNLTVIFNWGREVPEVVTIDASAAGK